jgi:hypothetical protein
MEISKLHNGDLVYGLYQNEEDEQVYKTVCKVLGYDPFNSFLWVESKDGIEEFIGFEPIPLTEEILLNKIYWNGYNKLHINSSFSLDKQGRLYYRNDYAGVNFKYLHKFQNFYILITGTELEINL